MVATKIGKMAFKMLEKNISVFCEEDVKEYGVSFTEVTLLSGLCTELPASLGRFCFVHFSVQVQLSILQHLSIIKPYLNSVLVL